MKKILYTIALGSLLASCDVSVENPNTLTQATYWQTEQDALYGVNAIYNMFYKPGTYSRWMWFRTDLTSDEGCSESPWAELKEWTRFKYNNYDFWEGNRWTYRDMYETIFRANQVLAYVPKIAFANETYKEQLLGQAYFLRGLSYYQLAVLWGSENKSLSIVLEPSKPADAPEGHTGAEVYKQAIDDFTEASKRLPEEWTGLEIGRATLGAAYGYRAKCYMQLHEWNSAEQDLKWLVEGAGKGHYDLVSYQDNFTKDNENNKESVFEIQYSDAHKAPAGDGDFDVDPNLGLNRGQFFAPPGIGWTDGELRAWIVDEFKKEKNLDGGYDIRLRYSAFYEGMDADFTGNNKIYKFDLAGADKEIWKQDNWKGRVFMRKYGSDYYRDYDDYHNPTNVRLLRFSDILLMYAECIANNSGDLSKAVGYVNRVRARVGMPELGVNHPQATTDKTAFLKRLQMERSLELLSEGHRWADLKRWGMLDTQAGIDELKSRDADFDNFILGRHACLPIPSLDKDNNPNLEQNPGY